MPSLEQLDQAVREFIAENPTDEVTVVVDASFGHRIDPSEVPAFEAAEAAGEVVSPPAGAIGRGDAFLLRIAEKTGATVLSNDSFQEFHGEHSWLFEKGKLIGGKPVPGVGWIFMDRTPVRGAKSREVIKEAKRRKRVETDETAGAKAAVEKPGRSRPKAVDRAIARATQEVVEPKAGGGKSRRRRSTAPPAEPVNEPLAFITFIAAHPLGNEVIGSVVEYSSHGAFVEADGARCYIPLSAMADPPPRKAREVVAKGESLTFVVQAFDPQRRGIELALPGFAHVAGEPTAETVEAEIRGEAKPPTQAKGGRRRGAAAVAAAVTEEQVAQAPAPGRRRRARAAEAPAPEAPAAELPAAEAPAAAVEEPAPARKAPARKAAAKKAPAPAKAAAKKAPAKRAPAKKAAAAVTEAEAPAAEAPAEKAAARKAPAKKAPAKKVAAKKAAPAAAPAKKAAARKAPAKKAAAAPEETAGAAPETPAKKRAPAKRAAKKAAPAAEEANGAPDRPPARRRAGSPAS